MVFILDSACVLFRPLTLVVIFENRFLILLFLVHVRVPEDNLGCCSSEAVHLGFETGSLSRAWSLPVRLEVLLFLPPHHGLLACPVPSLLFGCRGHTCALHLHSQRVSHSASQLSRKVNVSCKCSAGTDLPGRSRGLPKFCSWHLVFETGFLSR